MNINKKGTGGVALFFALVGLLLFFYILFLTPEERQEVLSELNTGETTLQTQPYTFTSFRIYTQTQDTILKEGRGINIQSSLWNTKTEKFNLTVPPNTRNLKLSITEENHNGNIIINLNNRTILNKQIEGHQILIVNNFQTNNELEVKTEPRTWWKIFGRNYYDLTAIQIFGTTVLNDYSMETKTFEITNNKKNIQTANISYTVTCPTPTPITNLTIKINNNTIKNDQPQCNNHYNYEINKRNLYIGFNKITFTTQTQGDYTIQNPKITTTYYSK